MQKILAVDRFWFGKGSLTGLRFAPGITCRNPLQIPLHVDKTLTIVCAYRYFFLWFLYKTVANTVGAA